MRGVQVSGAILVPKEVVMFTSRRMQSKRAFTLIELMVVVAILGVLGLVVATNVFPYFTQSQQTVAKTNIETLKAAVQKFKLDNFRLPETLEVLLEPNEKNASEPYIEDYDMLLDPWENEYVYIVESKTKFEIKSLGADGVEGGEGEDVDISSRDTRRSKE
jgi:general secretion pathway protein G